MSSTDACGCKECANLHNTVRTEDSRDENEVWCTGHTVICGYDVLKPTFLSSYKNDLYVTISHVHNCFFYKQANDV